MKNVEKEIEDVKKKIEDVEKDIEQVKSGDSDEKKRLINKEIKRGS